MVKKLFIRLVSSLAMLLVFTIALQGTAQAYASKVIINTGYKPWYTTETTPVSDVDVTVETVADAANAIPRNDSDKINPAERIFTRDAVNCPNGCHIGVNNAFGAHPTTNSYTFGMKDSFLNSLAAGSVSTVNNVIGGGSLQNMELPQFAWCVGDDANGIPIFKFKTSLSGNVNRSANGGTWKILWKWSVNGVDQGLIGSGTGTSISAPAHNDQETRVIFVYEENPPTYNINMSKAGPNPGNLGTPWQTSRMGMDGGNLQSTATSTTFSGILGYQDHSFFTDIPADWQIRGYSYNGGALTKAASFTIPANTVPNGETRNIRWEYDPIPSTIKAGILMKNGSSLQNPCNAPAGSSGRSMCGTVTLQAARTDTDAVSAGFNRLGGVIPTPGNNPGDITNLYPGKYSLTASGIPTGWKVVGYRGCDYGATNCYSDNAYTASAALVQNTDLYMNRTRPLYFVLEPVFTLPTVTASCNSISGTVGVPAGATGVKTQLILGGTKLSEVQNGTSFNFTGATLDAYRDGQSRAIKIAVTYDNVNGGQPPTTTEVDAAKNYLCANSSICAGNTINDATGGGFVSSSTTADGTSGTTYTIKVTMKNDGDSLWKDWSAERGYSAGHRLVLDSASSAYWTVAQGDMYVKPLTANPPVAGVGYPTVKAPQPDLYQFTFTAQLRSDVVINTNDIPLKFRMAWHNYGNTTPADMFGPSCGETVRPQLGYRPWLRVQNGSIATLEKALNQPAGTRGGRKVLNGTGYAELNLDVEFAITSAIDTVTQDNRFCSTNAYNYGRDFNPTWSCSFAGYSFKVGDKTKEAYINETDDSVYKQAVEMTGYKDCSNTTYNPSRQNLRTYSTAGDPIPEETFSQPTQNVSLLVSGKNRCGIVTPKTTGNLGPASLAAAPTTATISGGRATWIYNGDLTINSNIINGTGWSVADATDITNLNAIPNLGLIVNGNVTIGPNVSEIDATIYATGRISTCSTYPSETCNKSLKVKGSLAAKGGFALGRNYFDRDAIAARLGLAATSSAFDLQASIGDQNKYYGGPAEDIIGNGISLLLPPPGLEDYSANFYRPKYLPTDLSPRF